MKTDFLVIGSGITGLNFALNASQFGSVTVVTKKKIMESNTNLAQGGIAAVTRKKDTFQLHIADTLRVGHGLSNPRTVEILVKNGPKEVQNLISFGVKFDQENGHFHSTQEAGHSIARILHSGTMSGREIERALIRRLRENRRIEVYENHFAIQAISKHSQCYGATILDIQNQEIVDVFAHATIVATGGIGHLYQVTTNPAIATGDGIALAYRAGAIIEDMEFVQFHPTTLRESGDPHYLISETARGEGAVLVNNKGERFLDKYDALGELAPRDIVSRAVFTELKTGSAYLDMRHKDKNVILNRFGDLYHDCLKYNIDITRELVPITPAAHYICGGIKTNEYGETNIKRLLAFGECACTEVHGANRLASNSLLESLVFSSLGARTVHRLLKTDNNPPQLRTNLSVCNSDAQATIDVKSDLRKAMWNYVGIIRSEKTLNRMRQLLRQLSEKIDTLETDGISPRLIELKNMRDLSKLITDAAYHRKESRGTHYRVDYPSADDKTWLEHICHSIDGLYKCG